MLFVPLKTTEAAVPAREFLVYVVMLIVFMHNVSSQ